MLLLLLVCGLMAGLGTRHLLLRLLTRSADVQLTSARAVIFREIKEQELLLLNYADLIRFQQNIADARLNAPQTAILNAQLLTLLSTSRISAMLYPLEVLDVLAANPLTEQLSTAARSGMPLFRLANDADSPPGLSVAVPIHGDHGIRQILLLSTPLDSSFLHQILTPFQVKATICTSDRTPLVSTTADPDAAGIPADSVHDLRLGRTIFRTRELDIDTRLLLSAIPLGSNDMLLLTLEHPLDRFSRLITPLAALTGLGILFIATVGLQLPQRHTSTLMAALRTAMQEAARGNFRYRLATASTGRSDLIDAFNRIQERLEQADNDGSGQTRQQEQSQTATLLEQKDLELKRANEEIKGQLREIALLRQLNQLMCQPLEPDTRYERILGQLRDDLGCDALVLFLYNPATEELDIIKALGNDAQKLAGVSFRLSEGITGMAAAAQELFYVRNIMQDERYLSYKDRRRDRGSMVAAPILCRNQLYGVLNLHKSRIDAFSDVELRVIRSAACQLTLSLEHARPAATAPLRQQGD